MRTILVLAALMLTTTGCSNLTQESYTKLKVGMTYSEVTAILGDPTSCDDVLGLMSCQWGDGNLWGDGNRHVTVRFAGEKVLLYSAENIR